MKKCDLELITIEKDGFHLLVNVQINETNHKMVLDTGASKSVLDLNWVQNYLKKPVEFEDESSVGLGGDNLRSFSTIMDCIKVGGLELKTEKIAVIDLGYVIESYKGLGLPEIKGILGGDILKKYGATIDYKNLELTFN